MYSVSQAPRCLDATTSASGDFVHDDEPYAGTVLVPGEQFQGYVVDGILGRGGWAIVYRAHVDAQAPAPNRAVALKVLDERHRQPVHLARLQREFELANRLDHPHVIRVREVGPDWLTMELIDGGTITALPMMTDRLAALAQIADALDYTHNRGIVHCDVKPSNILAAKDFSQRGAVLIDFGVAHVLAEGVGDLPPAHVEASLPYAAPEILHGRIPSAASDEYALACTTVELITGTPPFTANTTMALVDQHLTKAPPQISRKIAWVPHAVDSILAKALAKTPDYRYDSCSEFVSHIVRALT